MKTSIDLMDYQVDLILKTLELYLYNYKFFYNFKKISETKEENQNLAIVRDTYEQINSQLVHEKKFTKIS